MTDTTHDDINIHEYADNLPVFARMLFGDRRVETVYDFETKHGGRGYEEGEIVVWNVEGYELEHLMKHYEIDEIVATGGGSSIKDTLVEIILNREVTE